MLGRTISHYRIEEKLGEGGMGVVYRATDLSLNRSVAIKFLSSKVADEERRRRFQQEAQTASALNHPHILTVFEAGTADFWLLELATGKTRPLTRLRSTAAMRTFDITPDGKQIVFDRLRENSDIVLIELKQP